MVNARTWFTLFILSVGTVAATASCGSDEGTANGSGGGSVISGGGVAGTAGRTSVGRAGSSSGAGGGSATNGSSLGIPCTTDAQCGSGATCIKTNSTLLGDGGPSQGMCSIKCTDDTECDAFKPGAGCFNFGTTADPQSYCLDACTVGLPDPNDLSTKCSGRSDMVCFDFGDNTVSVPFCVPHCRSDAECGTGLFCDKASLLGLCSKTKTTGDPVGTACTPGADTQTCNGFCIRTDSADNTKGQCVELCSVGAECMYGPGANPAPGGLCAGQLFATDPGTLDLGFCLPNCSCSSDCVLEGDLCRKWPAADQDIASVLGAPGVCFGAVAGSTELICGEGGAGGDGSAGEGPGAAGTPGAGGTAGTTNTAGTTSTAGTINTAGTTNTAGTGGT